MYLLESSPNYIGVLVEAAKHMSFFQVKILKKNTTEFNKTISMLI